MGDIMTGRTAPAHRGFAQLAERPYADVLIIGGGINGLATFRDLAMQGVDVALVERDDFISGASAASSHMIHGGIRYLENGEFRLVQEAVTERNALLRLAPHYVRPLQTTIPIFSTFSGVLSAPLRFLRHGGGQAPRARRGADQGRARHLRLVLARRRARAAPHLPRAPALARRAAGAEPGRQVHGDLLGCLAARPRAARDRRAPRRARGRRRPRPCRELHGGRRRRGRARRAARHRDGRGGAVRGIRRHQRLRARGPTSPTSALGDPTRYMGGTKGSHIVLDHPELLAATGGRELFFENNDGRIVLIYPLKGRVLVGTTDLEHDMGDPIVCTEDEVDYFIDLVGQVLPADPRGALADRLPVRRRPARCPATATSPPGSSRATTASRPQPLVGRRRHGAEPGRRQVDDVPRLGRDLADRALELLARPRRRSTKGVAIGGGRGFPTTDERARSSGSPGTPTGFPPNASRRCSTGTARSRRRSSPRSSPTTRTRRCARCPSYSTGELRHLAGAEDVVHLDDLLHAPHEPRVHGRGDARRPPPRSPRRSRRCWGGMPTRVAAETARGARAACTRPTRVGRGIRAAR